MNFIVEKKESYAIITMNTERLDQQTVAELRSELVLLSGDSFNNMILDLSQCTYCNTAGLSAILIAHRLCKDGMLVLAGVNQSVENMLSIQRFNPALTIVANIAEAEARIAKHIAE